MISINYIDVPICYTYFKFNMNYYLYSVCAVLQIKVLILKSFLFKENNLFLDKEKTHRNY